MLYTIILSVITLICILLTIVVLLQPGQGQGMAGMAGGMGSGGGQGLGARRTADLLSKSTTVLGTALIVLSILANFAIERGGPSESAVQQSGVEQPVQQQQDGLNNPSETPSAVPELPQNQGSGSESNDGESGSDGGGN